MTEKHHHKKTEEELMKEGLEAIYGHEKHKDDSVSTIVKAPKNRLTRILLWTIFSLIGVAVIVVTSFLIYTRIERSSGVEPLVLTIEGPETAVSGAPIAIEVRYKNPKNIPIANLEIDLNLPKGFLIETALPEPTNAEDFVYQIGSIGSYSDGVITLTGTWVADLDSELPLQAFASYRPANFNSEFQTIEKKIIKTTDTLVSTTVTGPSEGRAGDELTYTIVTKNTSETQTLTSIVQELTLPEGFYLTKSNPTIEAGGVAEYTIATLPPLAEHKAEMTGTFASDIEGLHSFKTTPSLLALSSRYSGKTEEVATEVLKSALKLSLVVNGADSEALTRAGSTMRVSVSLENTSTTPISDVELLLDFQSGKPVPISWSNATLDGGRVTSAGILFSKTTIGTIAPGTRKTLNLIFPVKGEISATDADRFTLVGTATTGNASYQSSPLSLAIATNLSFTSLARYYDASGNALGAGPLPPTVGTTTNYRIEWIIKNSLHDLRSIDVEAVLPPDVIFVRNVQTDLGELTFNESTRTVRLSIAEIPKTLQTVSSSFEVAITPTSDELNTFVKLLSGSTLHATDAEINLDLQSTTDSLTTDLEFDPFAKDKGAVIN